MAKLPWKTWHEVVKLRDDLRSGELPLHLFAADLYEVMMQNGKRPVYEEPGQFFALTFPTHNLRNLVRDVVLRLAGKNDKAVRQLELTYGGGKTHTLITLRHMVAGRVKLCFTFRPVGRARAKTLTFEVGYPDRCTLTDATHDQIARKYLREWGIARAARAEVAAAAG